MKLTPIFVTFVLSTIIGGCVYQREIMRPDEKRQAINFSSDSARNTFTCTIKKIEEKFPLDKKQKDSTTANLLIVNLYTKDYFLSENAYFNYIVGKTDTNKDSTISKEEAIYLYKSYFPNHRYVVLTPEDGFFKDIEAMALKPFCDIHA